MRPRRSVWGLLVGGIVAAAPIAEADAACDGPYAPCFSADNAWPQPFFDSGLGSVRLGRKPSRYNAGLSLGYQREPLLQVAASPDPFGTETAILNDWVTARALFAVRFDRIEFGLTWPLSLGGSGTGLAGVTTRTESSTVAGVGSPHLLVRARIAQGRWTWAVTQELVLPLYSEQSFLGTYGFGYAPMLTGQWDPQRGWVAVSVGARLQKSAEFGPVKFGSSAVVQTSAGVHLSPLFALFAEGWLLPALSRDEYTDPWVTRQLRRIPAEVLVGGRLTHDPLNVALGVGTSLPLTVEDTQTRSTRFAGPPSPSLRLELRLEADFE